MSITWVKKDDKNYRIIDIETWEEMIITKIKLEKDKVILEKKIIKNIISDN